jgi:vitamin B12 transporter
MASPFCRALCALFALAMYAAPAAAQTAATPEIVVTPYYSPTLLSQTGASITVIPGEQIAGGGSGSLSQVLRSVPGVNVIESGGPGGTAEVRLRGAETGHTLVLIDGVRVNDFATARDDFDFSLVAPAEIERIEILRGPQSAIYGSDAIGGVINIITRKAAREKHRSSASVEIGSYGTNSETLSTSMNRGDLSLRIGGSHHFTSGFSRRGDRDEDEADSYEKWAGSFRGSYAPADGPEFEVGANGSKVVSEYDAASGAGAADAENDVTKTLLTGFARLTWPNAGSGIEHSLMAFGTVNARDNLERAPPTPAIPESHFRSRSFGAEYKAAIDFGRSGEMLIGGRLESENATYDAPANGFSTFASDRQLYALFVEHKVTVAERFHLAFNARYDGAFEDDGFLTGRATAVYDLAEHGTRLKASIGTGAKRPTAYMLANNAFQAMTYPDVSTGLRPERSFGLDAGIEQSLFDDAVRLSATGFYNRFRDLLETRTLSGNFFDVAYENTSSAMTAGLELTGEVDIVPGVFVVAGSYTYLHTEDAEGKPLRRRPKNAGSISATFRPTGDAEATLRAVYVGERYNSAGAVGLLPSYWRVDAEISGDLNDQTKVFARVENLFDARYQDPAGFNTPGLSAYLGLRWAN